MSTRQSLVLACVLALTGCGTSSAPTPSTQSNVTPATPAVTPPAAIVMSDTSPVATLLGKPVLARDLLSSAGGIGSAEVGISNLVLSVLMDEFCQTRQQTLSQEEIDSFWKTMQAGAQRANPDPTKPLPEPAFDEPAMQARLREAQAKLAATDLPWLERLAWQGRERTLNFALEHKTNAAATAYEHLLPLRCQAALYKHYGGKVVARQISIEPAGAYVKLVQEAEASGKLQFHHEGLKQAFWKRMNDALQHNEVPPERVDFSLPVWMQFAAQSPPAIAPTNSSAAHTANDPGMTANGQDAPKRSVELQVLDRFVGTWEFDVTNIPATGAAITGKTSETRTWTLGGKFVQFENPQTGKPDEPEFQMLVTYDPATKDYPGVLMSGPNRAVVTGTWDQKTLTMTFRGTFSDASGTRFEYASRFLDSDHCESSGVISGATGEVIVKQMQKQARSKK